MLDHPPCPPQLAARLAALVVLCSAAVSFGCFAHLHGEGSKELGRHDERPSKQHDPRDGEKTPQMGCETYCSSDRIGTPGLRLTLPAATVVDDSRSRLDWTVHKGGFEAGAYQRFDALEPSTWSAPPEARPGYPAGEDDRLQMVAVERREDGARVVAIEGLEPGLLYRWRLAVRGGQGWRTVATATCGATVCPADYVDRETAEPGRVPR